MREAGHAHVNALLASALSLAASALSASEMSFRLSFASIGDGGCDVAGVDGGEEASLELDMIGSPFVGYCRCRVCVCGLTDCGVPAQSAGRWGC